MLDQERVVIWGLTLGPTLFPGHVRSWAYVGLFGAMMGLLSAMVGPCWAKNGVVIWGLTLRPR